VLHQRTVAASVEENGISFQVDLVHRAEQVPTVDIIRERWKVTAFPTDGSYHGFDLQSTQESLTDVPLVINPYHYGGFAVRGPMAWLSTDEPQAAGKDKKGKPGCVLVNDQRSDRIAGNHQKTRWVSMSGEIDGQPRSIVMMSAQENLRAPQTARLHPHKPYFCFTPCLEESIVINRSKTLHSTYRYLITDAAPDPDWIDQQWKKWQSGL